MENFNRVLSFIIGFIVIIVIIAIIAGRLNLRERFANVTSSLRRTATITPTPRISPYISVTPIVGNTRQPTPTTTYYNGKQPTKIPSTGPTLFIPLALGALYVGKKLSNFRK